MELMVEFNLFNDIMKQINTVYKQDKNLKTENKIMILRVPHFDQDEVDIPIFFRTSSTRVCQPLHCRKLTNELDDMDLQLPVVDILDKLSSFRNSKVQPNTVIVTYKERSAYVNISIVVPPDPELKYGDPQHFVFNFPMIEPQHFVVKDFITLMSNTDINYTSVSLGVLQESLNSFSHAFKFTQKHMTKVTYLRFTRAYIYMRTFSGLLSYKNPLPDFSDLNLTEDAMKVLLMIANSTEPIYMYRDTKEAVLYIKAAGCIFIIDYHTKYNEDAELMDIFHLASRKQTMVLETNFYQDNLARVKNATTAKCFVRTMSGKPKFCLVTDEVLQSQYLLKTIGEVYKDVGFYLIPTVFDSITMCIKQGGSPTLNFHLGVRDKVVTIGITDETKRWYSLISVQGILGDDLNKLLKDYEKIKF